jgi:hypothetical protein
MYFVVHCSWVVGSFYQSCVLGKVKKKKKERKKSIRKKERENLLVGVIMLIQLYFICLFIL